MAEPMIGTRYFVMPHLGSLVDEITRLRADVTELMQINADTTTENTRLREALEQIAKTATWQGEVARQALGESNA